MAEHAFDVTIAVNYYAPYVSGLTVAARDVAESLAARGWNVAVVASRHDRSLARREEIAGVQVVRTPVVATIGKGVISPTFPSVAARTIRRSRVGNLHLPMIEAGIVSRLVRGRVPLAVTYQCDVVLGSDPVSRLTVRRVDGASRAAARRAAVVIASSDDYARSSRVIAAYAAKTVAIPPPCVDRSGGTARFREGTGLHVGFLGRIVAEKGIEHLVEAFRGLPDPDARLLIAGDYERVAGGSVVERVRDAMAGDGRIRLLGFLHEEQLADFYASLDVFVLPSVNPLEAFGIVQVEAMLAGVPVIASDRPGVSVPVRETGFGALVPAADPVALRDAISAIRRTEFGDAAARARSTYSVAATVDAYETLLSGLAGR